MACRAIIEHMLGWLLVMGVCQGVFALFTMYLPPLFPTLLRTTGAGFSYNIGRLAAAFGTVYFGTFSQGGRLSAGALLFGVSCLFRRRRLRCCCRSCRRCGTASRWSMNGSKPAAQARVMRRNPCLRCGLQSVHRLTI